MPHVFAIVMKAMLVNFARRDLRGDIAVVLVIHILIQQMVYITIYMMLVNLFTINIMRVDPKFMPYYV